MRQFKFWMIGDIVQFQSGIRIRTGRTARSNCSGVVAAAAAAVVPELEGL